MRAGGGWLGAGVRGPAREPNGKIVVALFSIHSGKYGTSSLRSAAKCALQAMLRFVSCSAARMCRRLLLRPCMYTTRSQRRDLVDQTDRPRGERSDAVGWRRAELAPSRAVLLHVARML